MRIFPRFPLLFLVLIAACGGDSPSADHQEEWRQVLEQKKAASQADAPLEAKQRYADSVQAFVMKNPEHTRAREVWSRIRLEFADELMELGRPQDALRFYRAVLTDDPQDRAAQVGARIANERMMVTRDKLLRVEKGMSQRQVRGILGAPLPGWTRTSRRRTAEYQAWYYRTQAGRVAAVYFRKGRVIAAEESSDARLARLGS